MATDTQENKYELIENKFNINIDDIIAHINDELLDDQHPINTKYNNGENDVNTISIRGLIKQIMRNKNALLTKIESIKQEETQKSNIFRFDRRSFSNIKHGSNNEDFFSLFIEYLEGENLIQNGQREELITYYQDTYIKVPVQKHCKKVLGSETELINNKITNPGQTRIIDKFLKKEENSRMNLKITTFIMNHDVGLACDIISKFNNQIANDILTKCKDKSYDFILGQILESEKLSNAISSYGNADLIVLVTSNLASNGKNYFGLSNLINAFSDEHLKTNINKLQDLSKSDFISLDKLLGKLLSNRFYNTDSINLDKMITFGIDELSALTGVIQDEYLKIILDSEIKPRELSTTMNMNNWDDTINEFRKYIGVYEKKYNISETLKRIKYICENQKIPTESNFPFSKNFS